MLSDQDLRLAMKHDFTDLDPSQTREFLKHFKSIIRDPEIGMICGDGSASHRDGFYETEQAASFTFDGQQLFVIWRIVQTNDGRLVSIENVNRVDDPSFDETLHAIVSRVLERVITKKKDRYFQRSYLRAKHGWPMQQEYWIGGFRFAQLFPEDDSHHFDAERIYTLDLNVDAVDLEHAREIAQGEASDFGAFLSVILDIAFDWPVHEQRYFLSREGSTLQMHRASTQLIDMNIPSQMPRKGELCQQARFEGSVYSSVRYATEATLTLPVETRRFFRRMKEADSNVQLTAVASCRMYQLGLILGERRPSVKVSYQYGAIDAIVSSDKAQYRSFTDFMTNYTDAQRDLCDLIHSKVRSAHWHAGNMPLGELNFEHASGLYFPARTAVFSITMESHRLMRLAILRWIDEKIGFSADS